MSELLMTEMLQFHKEQRGLNKAGPERIRDKLWRERPEISPGLSEGSSPFSSDVCVLSFLFRARGH